MSQYQEPAIVETIVPAMCTDTLNHAKSLHILSLSGNCKTVVYKNKSKDIYSLMINELACASDNNNHQCTSKSNIS